MKDAASVAVYLYVSGVYVNNVFVYLCMQVCMHDILSALAFWTWFGNCEFNNLAQPS